MSRAPSPISTRLSPEVRAPAAAGFSTTEEPSLVVNVCIAAANVAGLLQVPLLPTGAQCLPERHPCDVVRLELLDQSNARSLVATKPLRGQQLGTRVPKHIRDDLTRYDLVLERAADYEGRRVDNPVKSAEESNSSYVNIERTMSQPQRKLLFRALSGYSGACENGTHPHVAIAPKGEVSCEPKRLRVWRSPDTDTLEFVGKPSREAQNAGTWHSFLPYWTLGLFGDPQEWEVVATSCGIPDAPPAAEELVGLVRVYSRDKYEFNFTLPAFLSFAGEKAGKTNVFGTRTESSSRSLTLAGETVAAKSSSNSTSREGDTTEKSSSSEWKHDGTFTESNETTRDAGGGLVSSKTSEKTKTRSLFNPALSKRTETGKTRTEYGYPSPSWSEESDLSDESIETKASISLKKNGQDLDVSKFLNNTLNIATKMKDAVEEIGDLLPAVGWKLSLDVKLLEGSLAIKWGKENPEDIESQSPLEADYEGARYLAVRRYWTVEANIVLFGATFTAMFGIELKVNAIFWKVAEIVIKVEGKLSGEHAVKWSWTSDKPRPPEEGSVVFKGSVSGVCKANLAGYHLVDSAAVLSGGFRFTCLAHASDSKAPGATGKLERLDTNVIYYGSIGKEPPEPAEWMWFKGKPIWEGELLSGTHVA